MKRFKTNRMFFSAGAILIGLILLIWPASSLMIIGKCLGVLLAAGGVASGIAGSEPLLLISSRSCLLAISGLTRYPDMSTKPTN